MPARVWEGAWERKTWGTRSDPSVEPRSAVRWAPCPRPAPPPPEATAAVTDSNPTTTGHSVPHPQPLTGRRVCLSAPLARPGRVPAIWEGRTARRAGLEGPDAEAAARTCAGKVPMGNWGSLSHGLVRSPAPRGGSPRSSDISSDTRAELGTAAGEPGHKTRDQLALRCPTRVPTSPLGARSRVHAAVRPPQASPT